MSGQIGTNKLIDSSVFIDCLRSDTAAYEYLLSLAEIKCSAITAAELLRGCKNKDALVRTKKLIASATVLPLTISISNLFLNLIEKFAASHGLRIPDALIAATALENNLSLITHNTKHFHFIPGLKVIDWKNAAK